MLKQPGTYASAKEFLEDAIAITAEVSERAQRVLLLGNSGGLALTLGIAAALVGTKLSPTLTLWPAMSFALGVLTVGAQPVIMAWRMRPFLDFFDNLDATVSNLEDDLKQLSSACRTRSCSRCGLETFRAAWPIWTNPQNRRSSASRN